MITPTLFKLSSKSFTIGLVRSFGSHYSKGYLHTKKMVEDDKVIREPLRDHLTNVHPDTRERYS